MSLIRRLSLHYILQGFAQGLFVCIISLFMIEKGFALWQLGISFGAYGLTAAILELPLGAVADLYGRIRVFRWSLISNCAAFLLAAAIPSFWPMLIPMMMLGFGRALETGSISAWQVEQFNKIGLKQQLSALLARLQATNAAALAIGALIGGYLPGLMSNLIPFILPTANNLLAAAGVCLIHICMLPWLFQEGDLTRHSIISTSVNTQIQIAVKHGYKNQTIRSIMLLSLIFGLILANLEAYWQPFLSSIIAPNNYVIFGWLTTGYFFSAALGPLIYTATIARTTITSQSAITIILTLLAPILYILANSTVVGQFALFYFLFMGVLICINIPVQVLLNEHTDDAIRSSMQSVLSMALQTGAVLSAIVIAPIIQWLGIRLVWQLLSGSLLLIAILRIMFSFNLFNGSFDKKFD